MITDTQRLIKATSRFGHEIPVYDDGFGPLWIHRHSIGISGIVRAQTWEDAYSICEDEFFPEADETMEELRAQYNVKREHAKMIRPPSSEGGNIRPATLADYPLAEWQFVEWKTIETPCEDENGWVENELFCEAFGFRPSGPNSKDVQNHGIYAKDLNGDRLDILTPKLADELGITLTMEDES